MVSTSAKTPWHGIRRMLTATIALTLLYIALEALFGGVASFLDSRGWAPTGPQGRLQEEARRVAEASASRESQFTAKHRLVAFSLGIQLGQVARYLANFSQQDIAIRQQARTAAAPRMKDAQVLADFLAIGPVYPLESSTLAQVSGSKGLTARVEADEGGIGARIAERTTPRHRHLYLLGMHVGMALASMQSKAWRGGTIASEEIARQATLAGLNRDQWEPLARVPRGATQPEVAAAYEAAVRNAQQAIRSQSTALKR